MESSNKLTPELRAGLIKSFLQGSIEAIDAGLASGDVGFIDAATEVAARMDYNQYADEWFGKV